MSERIPQSVVIEVIFMAYLAADHVTPATGKTIAVTISKNHGALGNPSAGATNATAISNGCYYVALSGTDTGTLGNLWVHGAEATIDDVNLFFRVVEPNSGGFAGVPSVAAGAAGGLPLSVDAAGRVDVLKINGSSQTGADVGGIVLTVSTNLNAKVSDVKTKTDYLPSATAGAAGGVFIAGTNAPVTITGSGNALTLTSTGANGNGLAATGNGTGSGIAATSGAGATGAAITATSAVANGHGIYAIGSGTGNGLAAQGGATGAGIIGTSSGTGTGLQANITGNITGNLSGTVVSAGSITGNVNGNVSGNVTGSVGSVSGNVAGSVGSLAAQAKTDVENAVLDADVGTHHTTAGSAGKGIHDAALAGDPWPVVLPGAYAPGSAGYILGHVSGSAGAGSTSWPITIEDDNGAPLGDVDVWVTTDAGGTAVVASGKTDNFGVVSPTFMLDPGLYYVWRQKTGYTFNNPAQTTVT